MKYQTWTTQIQVHATWCLTSSTELLVLILNHRLSYQAYKYMRDDSCFCTQVFVSYILSLSEHHEETRSAHLAVSNTTLAPLRKCKRQDKSNCSNFNNWTKNVLIVYTISLFETLWYQPSLVSINRSIRFSFDLVDPFTINNIFSIYRSYQVSCIMRNQVVSSLI
jgi:hypothetical protein